MFLFLSFLEGRGGAHAGWSVGRPRLKISDFGESEIITKLTMSDGRRRRSGNTGTLDYVAPELLAGSLPIFFRRLRGAGSRTVSLMRSVGRDS